MAHCGTKGGTNAGVSHTLEQPEKGGQEAHLEGTINGAMDLRGHLEVGRLEDTTDTVTHHSREKLGQ